MNSIDITHDEASVAYTVMSSYIMNHAAFNQVTPEMVTLVAKLQNHLDALEAAEAEVVEVVEEVSATESEAPAEAPAEVSEAPQAE